MAERGDPPAWEPHQLVNQAHPVDEQRTAERVDAATKPVKAKKTAKAKVQHLPIP